MTLHLFLLSLAALVSFGIIVIGILYLASPKQIVGNFGLTSPVLNANTCSWLRTKGVRDVTSGLLVLTLMLTTNSRTVGIALLVLAAIPFGDLANVLGSGGSKSKAFSIHGITCAVMLVAGFLLIHAF